METFGSRFPTFLEEGLVQKPEYWWEKYVLAGWGIAFGVLFFVATILERNCSNTLTVPWRWDLFACGVRHGNVCLFVQYVLIFILHICILIIRIFNINNYICIFNSTTIS